MVAPRAQKFNKFLGQQIRIEINQQKIDDEELNPNHAESQNLLFYDFNGSSQKFNFNHVNGVGLGSKNDFRRTGMAGAKFVSKNIIDPADIEKTKGKRRPTTSQFRCGDRLPSRASKTRDRSKRIHIGARKPQPARREQQGAPKQNIHGASVSPKGNRADRAPDPIKPLSNGSRHNIHTAVPNKKHRLFAELNGEEASPARNAKYRFREPFKKKNKDVIIEEEEDNEEDQDKFSQNIC